MLYKQIFETASLTLHCRHQCTVESSWNVMAHGDEQEGKCRGNWRMEFIASTVHTASEHGVSSITTITTADAHTSAASSRLNWRPRRFKWTRPFRRKTKSVFCACAITFQTQSTNFEFFTCRHLDTPHGRDSISGSWQSLTYEIAAFRVSRRKSNFA